MITVLQAIKQFHTNDETIQQYISQGVYLSVAPDNIDITQGGLLILEHLGEERDKISTETVRETTRLNLIYSYPDLPTLDVLVVPWAKETFDDTESSSGGVLSIDNANVVSVDIEGQIHLGLEAATDKLGNNIFSATVPITVIVDRNRVRTEITSDG